MAMLAILMLVPICTVYCQDWQLVWEDNFDTLDLTKWQHEITAWGGGNFEFQVYTQDSDNSYVKDGLLFIKPTPLVNNINPKTGEPFGEEFLTTGTLDLWDMYGGCTMEDNGGCYRLGSMGNIPPIMSARMRTFERFSFKYGRAEMRAKMPVGDWMWPAMWMLPEDWVYGGWPVSGEIDIIEIIGNRDLKIVGTGEDVGIQKMGVTLHWGVDWSQNRYYLTHASKHDHGNNYADNFHDYVFEWDENGMSWTVDGQLLYRVPDPPINEQPGWNFYDYGAPWNPPGNPWTGGSAMAPFDANFHFILNVAVGGTIGFIPDNVINRGDNSQYGKPWTNGQDYVQAMNDFWNARSRWEWTWNDEGDNAAMQVDYIRVYQRV